MHYTAKIMAFFAFRVSIHLICGISFSFFLFFFFFTFLICFNVILGSFGAPRSIST